MRWYYTYYSTPLFDTCPIADYDQAVSRSISPMAVVVESKVGQSGLYCSHSTLVDTSVILQEAIESWLKRS